MITLPPPPLYRANLRGGVIDNIEDLSNPTSLNSRKQSLMYHYLFGTQFFQLDLPKLSWVTFGLQGNGSALEH